MNTYPLNAAGLDVAVRYATSAGLAGQANILFVVSEQNQVPMHGQIDMLLSAAGELSSQAILTAYPAAMELVVTADIPFNNTFLVGAATMSFDVSGGMVALGQLQGGVVIPLDAVGALSMVGFLNGESDTELTVNGLIRSTQYLGGSAIFVLDVIGAMMSNNPLAADDDARSFRRPFQQREFRR